MPCKVARPELSLAISPVSTRKRGIRRASSVEAEAAEFFLWIERHARQGRPPHQAISSDVSPHAALTRSEIARSCCNASPRRRAVGSTVFPYSSLMRAIAAALNEGF